MSTENKELLLSLYETMYRIRKFEEKASELFEESLLPGFVHLYLGQEAVAAGVCAHLTERDFITSTHRGHGHLIAKGGDLKLMMAELFGKKTGYCKGKGGSMHIADISLGILGANGIVGAGQPIAAGAALACQMKKTGGVAISFFGDGASNRGTFHESMNLASAWKLPMIYIIENNLYAISTRQTYATTVTDLAVRAAAYGIPGEVVDGNDVQAVYEAAGKLIERARKGEGPAILECKTWKHHGHFEGDPCVYKEDWEQEKWLANDPVIKFHDLLGVAGNLKAEVDEIETKVMQLIDEAEEFARSSPDPEPESILIDVYAD